MSSLCGYCASRSARLARSASLPKSIRPQAAASTSLPRLESAPRSTHSAAKSSSLWAARVSRRGFSHAATSPATPSPRCTTLVNATRVYRRFIACKAEPPTNPSEDFEPVEQELKEGEALEMHLTEAAIKVRRLSVHSFLTTRLFHPLSFRSLKVSYSRAHSRPTHPRSKSNERRRKRTTRLCRSGSSSRVAAATDTSTRCRSRTSETAMTSASLLWRSFQSGILAVTDSFAPRSTSRFAPPTETTASLLVDSASLPLVKGSTIDYATELIGSAFRIKDNPQSKDAGCGCGVSELSVFA